MGTLSSQQRADLLQAAEHAAHKAYAPYSRFYVGAALLLESGEIVSGANVENASYRLTSCAEQAALCRAVSEFGPAIRVVACAVHNLNATACQPCGACRQTLAEFAGSEALILFPGAAGEAQSCTLADLLPASFKLQPDALEPARAQ